MRYDEAVRECNDTPIWWMEEDGEEEERVERNEKGIASSTSLYILHAHRFLLGYRFAFLNGVLNGSFVPILKEEGNPASMHGITPSIKSHSSKSPTKKKLMISPLTLCIP